jgi:hypothetical protein
MVNSCLWSLLCPEEDSCVFSAHSADPKCNDRRESHGSIYLPLPNRLRRSSDDMGLRDFLGLPKRHRRKESKARSEIGPNEGTGEVDLVLPRPTAGSAPDLQIGTSTSTTTGPSTTRGQEPNGTQSFSSRFMCLTALFFTM